MLRRIDIDSFRGFTKLTAELAPVTVLLGPNSSGKSSVLQAVRLACAALALALRQELEPKVRDGWIEFDLDYRDVDVLVPAVDPEELFLNTEAEGFELSLTFEDTDFVQELHVSLDDGLNGEVRLKSQQALGGPSGARSKSRRLVPLLASKAPIAVAVPSFYGVLRHEPYVNDARLERLLGAGEQGSVVRNLVGRLGGRKELSDLLLLSVGAEIVRSTSGQELQDVENLAVAFRDRNGDLELSAAGTGLVALTALFAALKWYQPRAAQGRPLLFLLDEPEAHLHPKLQGDTGERLADLVTRFGAHAQVLLATHSVEMVNRLGRRPDAVLLSIDRGAADAAVPLTTENEVIERLESFCDLSPFNSLQLLRSRRVLFHEGKTDRAILEGCAHALFANDPAGLEQFRRWTLAELSSETNAAAKDVLKKALAPLTAAGTGGEPVRIVRVLDRDYHRAPAQGPEQGDANLKEYDVVWSRHSIESLFLDPPCLAAWLRLALEGRPGGPTAADLQRWVAEGIASADADAELVRSAAEQIFTIALRKLTLGEAGSTKKIVDARRDAEAQVASEPRVFQNGRQRARHVLSYVRGKLPAPLQNRVRSDVADVVRYTPSANILTAPALVPPEIEALLKYLAA
jgi:hypothetical protein